MTLCIAALCREQGEQPAAVLSFDRRIETGIAGGEVQFKFRWLSKHWCALFAGEVSLAVEVLMKYARLLNTASIFDNVSVVDVLRLPLNEIREQFADRYVREMLAVSYQDLLNGSIAIPEDVRSRIFFDLPDQTPKTHQLQLLLVGWCKNRLRLFRVCGTEIEIKAPFAAIGAGANIAEPALFQRQHLEIWPLGAALYSVYEAHHLGSIAPGVGKDADLAVISFKSETDELCLRAVKAQGRTFLNEQYEERFGLRPLDLSVRLPDDSFATIPLPPLEDGT